MVTKVNVPVPFQGDIIATGLTPGTDTGWYSQVIGQNRFKERNEPGPYIIFTPQIKYVTQEIPVFFR